MEREIADTIGEVLVFLFMVYFSYKLGKSYKNDR